MNVKKENILVIDIGNSYTKIAVFKNNEDVILKLLFFKTNKKCNINFITKKINHFIKFDIKHAIIGSVVPSLKNKYNFVINKMFKISSYTINQKTKFSFFIKPSIRKEIGDDLLALSEFCISKNSTAIGISFGTAIASVFLKNKELKGASISSGLGFGINYLIYKASLINKFKINSFANNFYGDSTISALEAGIYNLRNGYILSFYNETKKIINNQKLYCVLTGGEAKNVNLENIDYELNYYAILIGFKMIYFLNNKKKSK